MTPTVTPTSRAVKDMKPKTIESLRDLVRALVDSSKYLKEAAVASRDEMVANTLSRIAAERQHICDEISGLITIADEKPIESGSFLGTLRTIWAAFRAGINAGNPTVVLIEAERAEDVIVNRFKQILPEISGNPINDKLIEHFAKVKNGHDQVLNLRNAYQNA